MRALPFFASALALLAGSLASAVAQRPGAFGEGRDHPAIRYTTAPVNDPVHRLNVALESGAATLAFDQAAGGYLRSVLGALEIPVASQVLAFAETSLQARKINRGNPRAIYFNDTVAVGWVRGGDVLEVASHDPQQGVIFYTLPTTAQAALASRATTRAWPATCRGTPWRCRGWSCRRSSRARASATTPTAGSSITG
jgi:hypothetical protein